MIPGNRVETVTVDKKTTEPGLLRAELVLYNSNLLLNKKIALATTFTQPPYLYRSND